MPAVPEEIDPDTGLPIPGTGSPEIPAVPEIPAIPGTDDQWLPAPVDRIVPADATKVRKVAWSLAWGATQTTGFDPMSGTLRGEFDCG